MRTLVFALAFTVTACGHLQPAPRPTALAATLAPADPSCPLWDRLQLAFAATGAALGGAGGVSGAVVAAWPDAHLVAGVVVASVVVPASVFAVLQGYYAKKFTAGCTVAK
jgi:hypothetical protein